MGEYLLLMEVHRVDKALLVRRVVAYSGSHGAGGAGSEASLVLTVNLFVCLCLYGHNS